jgi:hypothetical protein
MWNSSPGMYDYPSNLYFDPWCGSLCYGKLPNYFAYRWLRAEIFYFGYICSRGWIHMANILLSPLEKNDWYIHRP